MKLHRSPPQGEWEYIDPGQWNKYQRRAAETNGWDTPGNRITAAGGVLSLAGLVCISRRKTLTGAILVGAGRAFDLWDGRRAEATGTKSPKGEAADATTDTVLMGVGAVVLTKVGIISETEGKALGALHGIKSIINVPAKLMHREPHPTASAKIGAFGQWVGIGLRTLSRAAEEHDRPELASGLNMAGTLSLRTGMALGAVGVGEYTINLLSDRPEEDSLVPVVTLTSDAIPTQ
jgi:phosphatidylglycerophosphate synthase